MKNYNEFELRVQYYCKPEDFKRNVGELKQVSIDNYQLFIDVLILGAEITPAVRIVDELVKISIKTPLTPREALSMEGIFKLIANYFDIQMY